MEQPNKKQARRKFQKAMKYHTMATGFAQEGLLTLALVLEQAACVLEREAWQVLYATYQRAGEKEECQ